MKEKNTFFLLRIIEKGLNKLKLREKIIGLFIFCVIIPIILTDGIILQRLLKSERTKEIQETEQMAMTVSSLITDVISDCERIATSARVNDNIGEFLGNEYQSNFDYYEGYYNISSNFFFQTLVGFDNTKVKLYTSNGSIVNGGYVGKIDSVVNEGWYKEYINSGLDTLFICCVDDTKSALESKRSIYYIKKLNFVNNTYDNFIRIDVDYSTIMRRLGNMGYSNHIYVCDEDGRVLLSNVGMNSQRDEFEIIDFGDRISTTKNMDATGNLRKIYVLRGEENTVDFLKNNIRGILILLAINFVLPALVLVEIDYSIVHRIQKLDQAFGKRENDRLVKIDDPEGSDEIGNLITNYNKMADRVNQLIQIVYKDKLKEQEITLAKQNAELLALHSQINPHFMFNALESIRMHSVIKGENETAEMVEKLALMERQYVDWDSDMIEISREMNSVEAYLGLQKYRFGDKLMYELSVDDDCANVLIPKLTIVTFVENACVHGMENKNTECWVFVRVYGKSDSIVLEIEDTGHGMSEEQVDALVQKARTIELDDLKNMNHVGIYNAILRLKMTMGEDYRFDIESEEGVGTMIQITINRNEKC